MMRPLNFSGAPEYKVEYPDAEAFFNLTVEIKQFSEEFMRSCIFNQIFRMADINDYKTYPQPFKS